MGIHVIKVPDIGEGITEVELVAWHVGPGDAVTEDQPLVDVMTDKATVEIPSPVAGMVLALAGEVGAQLAVGAELIRLEVVGAGAAAPAAAELPTQDPQDPQDPPPSAPPRPEAAGAPQAPVEPAQARKPAEPGSAGASAPGESPRASPSVRRRAREHGVDLGDVRGSGPRGRVLPADLEGHAVGPAAPVPGATGGYAARHGEERIQVIGVRRQIARAMQASKRNIPHFSYVEEVDVTEVEALRAELNQRHAKTRGKLSLLPFLIRAIANAVVEYPAVNATYDEASETVVRHRAVHLGIATQTDAGLMVPVVRHAEALDPWACAREIVRLADAARSGRATRDALRGSTITLTSLGALGGIASTPVINPPEVAIVGVNRIVERPAYRDGHLVPRMLMNLSSSFDHRLVDGMVAAQFVQSLRAQLEHPGLLFIE